MKVLVTGASGFIGSHVCRALLDAGCEVGALTRANAIPPRLADIANQLRFISGSIYDMSETGPVLKAWRPDACLHLAWYVEPGKCLEAPENLLALNASLELIKILGEAGCAHIVTAGTCAEYDTEQGWLNENSLTRPETLYAATKLSLSMIGQQIAKSYDMAFAHARVFYVYGPYEDRRRVVPGLIATLLSGGTFKATKGAQVRDYLHVHDVASALVTLVRQEAQGLVNIASATPVSIRQLMEAVGSVMDQPDHIHYGAVPCRAWDPCVIVGDNARLRAMGWEPAYTLETGLRQTVEWWRGSLPSSLP